MSARVMGTMELARHLADSTDIPLKDVRSLLEMLNDTAVMSLRLSGCFRLHGLVQINVKQKGAKGHLVSKPWTEIKKGALLRARVLTPVKKALGV